MTQAEPKFCFCTLALGKKYRGLALLLAKDIEKYSPHTSFVVLTDHPDDFSKQSNVLAFKHRQQGVKSYHDKRFVIEKSLFMFHSCIFMDADMRILAPVVPQNITWLQLPGITARGCESIPKKYAKVIAGTANSKLYQEFQVTHKAAKKLNLQLESEEVKFVYEYLFAVTKDSGREIEFLREWGKMALYYELNGVYDAEGNAIGLAAAKAGLPVRWSAMEGITFFKDRTEFIKIQKGQSNMEEMSVYFEQQQMLEHPNRSLFERIVEKIAKTMNFAYNILNLRIQALKNFDFYYR
ncbi:hypothetical protein [Scytonema sp. PCC 10023]|uniref:hypothetical protein n=1 Tax=Scytonema sp. PCC 10023 TaxID=1680591 RepID=UPI0039C62AE1